jgi:DNA-binding GntR family transcriptional regulator
VQEQVVDHLRRLILDGDYSPGERLRQEDLAGLLGVSAMPVREGLRQLQAEGLVEFAPRRGAFVAQLSPDEFDELYHMREELEALALRWAIERLEPADIEELRHILDDVERAETQRDGRRRSESIRSFLWTIYETAGRPHLYTAICRYYNMTYLYQREYSGLLDVAARRVEMYRRLLAAIVAGDSVQADAIHRENYALVRQTMLPLLRGEKLPG